MRNKNLQYLVYDEGFSFQLFHINGDFIPIKISNTSWPINSEWETAVKKSFSTLSHMFHFCEQILNGLAPLKRMTSKIRGGVEKLIPPVLIFNRSLNVRSTTFPLFPRLILMDVSCCQTGRDFRSRRPVRNAVVGGFFVASSPFFRQYFPCLELSYLRVLFSALVLVWIHERSSQNCG